jgi:hypothetical protein
MDGGDVDARGFGPPRIYLQCQAKVNKPKTLVNIINYQMVITSNIYVYITEENAGNYGGMGSTTERDVEYFDP